MFDSLDPSSSLLRRDDPLDCQTARAPDYYGLGVRMGIYFAWMQAYIANTMLPSEIAGALDTNTIFLLTILVAMIKCTISDMLARIDGLILMHLAGGTIFGILSLWGYRTRQYFDEGPSGIRFFGGFGTHSRLLVSLAVSIYGLWFWLYGVSGALSATGPEEEASADPRCSTVYTFMFAKIRADGGIRIFYIIVCICCILYFGTMVLASGIAVWVRLGKMISLYRSKRWADTTRLRYASGFKYREHRVIFKTLRVLSFAWLVFSILLVEFSLNFNHVNAVLGGPHDNELHLPAQLLPLLIGAFGFVRISYMMFEHWRSPGDISPSISAPTTPRTSKTMHFGPHLLQAFSPAMARDAAARRHDDNEIDEMEKHHAWPVRYLVSWLPWLSLLKHFREEPGYIKEKRTSGFSEADERGQTERSGRAAGAGPIGEAART